MTEDDDDVELEDDEDDDDDDEEVEVDEVVLVEVEVDDVLGVGNGLTTTDVGGKGSFDGIITLPIGHESGQWPEMERIQRGLGLTRRGGGYTVGRLNGEKVSEGTLAALDHSSMSIHVGVGEMNVKSRKKESGGIVKRRP